MSRRLVIGAEDFVALPPADFTICAVRTLADASDSAYPVPGPVPSSVRVEPDDGVAVQRFLCTGIEVSGARRVFHASPVAAHVALTGSRLTIAGRPPAGGWLGGPLALLLNAGGRVRRRRRGMLVGHVRYPWLKGVYAQRKEGLFGVELVRLFVAREGGLLQLDLTLPSDVDALAVATALIARAGLAPAAELAWPPGATEMVGVSRP